MKNRTIFYIVICSIVGVFSGCVAPEPEPVEPLPDAEDVVHTDNAVPGERRKELNNAHSLHMLAGMLNDGEHHQEASKVLAQAVQFSPDNPKYWSRWGWTLQQMGCYEEAFEKHREACRLNPSDAYDQYCAAYCLGILGRDNEAAKYCRWAAELGHAGAQYTLGYCYEEGRGVEQSPAVAFKWYLKAAEQGLADAQAQVGYCLSIGLGCEKDIERSVYWLQKAAEQGIVMAWKNLGTMYGKGTGVPMDYDKALVCFKKALEIDPDHSASLNGYAWILATCKDESFRDYAKAIELAERSVALDPQFYNLDTLAVVYDHSGQFDKAIAAQKRLIAVYEKEKPGQPIVEEMKKRLETYEKKQARETP